MSRHLDELFAQFPTHLSVSNLSAILGVTKKTAYDYLQSGEVPAYRIGTKWVILRDEVRDFVLASAIEGRPSSPPVVADGTDSTEDELPSHLE
jgi:excisionase family DNA binding protein